MSKPWGKIRPAPKDHRVYTEPLIVFTLGSPGSGRFLRTTRDMESDPESDESDSAEPDEPAGSSAQGTTDAEAAVQQGESTSDPWDNIVPLPKDHRVYTEPLSVFTLGSPGSGRFLRTTRDMESDPESDESDSAGTDEAADFPPRETTDLDV